MAAPHHGSGAAVTPDTLITIKISVNDVAKRLKLPLRDLGINVLPDKLRQILDIKPDQHVVFERYSDSASGYVTLDKDSPQVFKTLVRAAKAKLKLRLKATVTPLVPAEAVEEKEAVEVGQTTASPKWPTSHHAEPLAALPSPLASMLNMQASIGQAAARDSTALDQRSVGSGIFQFREARASQQTLVNDEAPVPRPFVAEKSMTLPQLPAPQQLKCVAQRAELAFRSREPAEATSNFGHWSVYCNACDESMTDAHYHCSICDGGDYDLCEDCVASGQLCPGEGHWLIKRFIKDGKAIHSTTERISPRPRGSPMEPVESAEVSSAFNAKLNTPTEPVRTRTCNNCVVVLLEREFVTCTTCDDFDLCLRCHAADKHGHHPAHGLKPATDETVLTLAAETKLAPGRNVRHNAICDGCDQKIYGIRHKCLNCPDWDYCNECVKSAPITHRHHRFAALYEPIADQRSSVVRHYGIYCDGPLCADKPNQSYIHGVRYKCAICNDTDFCAACEALPSNAHNRTHPLIKFKTPVRNVNVSTENEDVRGNVRVMGDRRAEPLLTQTRAISTDVAPALAANAATQVHTVADIKPTEVKKDDAVSVPELASSGIPPMAMSSNADLNAHYVRDSVADGTSFEPQVCFAQVWTVRNPGPYAWPAGCSVRFVGGDNMLNVDNNHPASVTTIAEATESNVVGRAVGVGEEVAFKVVLKAPVRLGRAISYWRIKAPNGTPFGHRLWCDITVQEKFVPPVPQEARAMCGGAPAMRSQCIRGWAPGYRGSAEKSHQMSSCHNVAGMNEEERRAVFRQRIAQVKAEIQKKRALNEDALEEVKLACRHMMDKKANEGEKVKKIIEEVSKNAEPEAEAEVEQQSEQEEGEAENLEDSKMVFPTLDKESPASSTYQSMYSSPAAGKPAYVENEDGEIERSASPAAVTAVPEPIVSSPLTAPQADDLDEDIEVLSAVGDGSDDGFMTDEEYDILDASDQETVASP